MAESPYHPLHLMGIECFNQRDFFRSHEFWEELWRQTRGPDQLFYKGLIQAAVALFHLTNGNVHGTQKLLARARHYLAAYRSQHLGLDLDHFLVALSRCVDDALGRPGQFGQPVVDPQLIPEIRLEPSPLEVPAHQAAPKQGR
jgi:hypothetical protein